MMKNLLIIIMILLIHNESGDVEIVEKCTEKDDYLLVNYGYGWQINQPKAEYTCKKVVEID